MDSFLILVVLSVAFLNGANDNIKGFAAAWGSGLISYKRARAFGLAGVVGAVRFRNRLDDAKDAVFVFHYAGIMLIPSAGGMILVAQMGSRAGAVAIGLAFCAVMVFNLVTRRALSPARRLRSSPPPRASGCPGRQPRGSFQARSGIFWCHSLAF